MTMKELRLTTIILQGSEETPPLSISAPAAPPKSFEPSLLHSNDIHLAEQTTNSQQNGKLRIY